MKTNSEIIDIFRRKFAGDDNKYKGTLFSTWHEVLPLLMEILEFHDEQMKRMVESVPILLNYRRDSEYGAYIEMVSDWKAEQLESLTQNNNVTHCCKKSGCIETPKQEPCKFDSWKFKECEKCGVLTSKYTYREVIGERQATVLWYTTPEKYIKTEYFCTRCVPKKPKP